MHHHITVDGTDFALNAPAIPDDLLNREVEISGREIIDEPDKILTGLTIEGIDFSSPRGFSEQ